MNLLTDPLIPVREPSSSQIDWVSLPQLFAAWSDGQDLQVEDVRAYQQAAVETALAQFAAHALDIAGAALQPFDVSRWRVLLQALAEHEKAPGFWNLIPEGQCDAAFMQPALAQPIAKTKFVRTVVDLDVLTRSKNHELKQDEMPNPTPWDWCCALITLQTTAGYSGPRLQPIFRMNAGSGSRVFAACYNEDTPAARWREDVRRLAPFWNEVCEAGSLGFHRNGSRLLAALPWDVEAGAGVAMTALHPGTVEVARPIRFVLEAGGISGIRTTSTAPRVYVGDKKDEAGTTTQGAVEDPWTPTAFDDKKSSRKGLTVSGPEGFSPKTLLDIALERGCTPSPFMKRVDTSREVTFLLRVHAKSGTESAAYQEYRLVFPPRVALKLFAPVPVPTEREEFLKLCRAAEERAAAVVDRTRWAYLCAHSAPDATNEQIKNTAERKVHESVLLAMTGDLSRRWRMDLLPFICENNATAERTIELWTARWMQEARAEMVRQLSISATAPRVSPLRLAHALHVLDSFRP